MTKASTKEALSFQLDGDLTWRLKELSDLKSAIASALPSARTVLLRALITMIYAHWEGHVKFCATKYFQYLTLRKFPYADLSEQLYINSFLNRLDSFFGSRANLQARCQFVSDVLTSKGNRFVRIHESLIDTKSNLNSDVLRDICTICSIDFGNFEEHASFIDNVILKRRNSIAHGEEQYVDDKDIDDLVDRIIRLMRDFKNQLENKVYQETYRAA